MVPAVRNHSRTPRGRWPRRRPRGTSQAVRLLRSAPVSPCAACGRTTATTSDGVCADCWAPKIPSVEPPAQGGGRAPSFASLLRELFRPRW